MFCARPDGLSAKPDTPHGSQTARPLILLKFFSGTHLGLLNAVAKRIANKFLSPAAISRLYRPKRKMSTMKASTARRIACFSLLTLTVAIAHAAQPAANAPVQTRTSAPMANSLGVLPAPVLQVSPPDLAMISLVPSKTTVNRMEPFTLTYHIKNVSNKPIANARIGVTADYYPLSAGVGVGALAPGQEKTGTIDITVMKDSMMNMPPEPFAVHIKFTGTAVILGANNNVVPDLNPANDKVTTVTVKANPG
jgi:hypothetical protein